jgi:hypothetical protein
MLRTETKVLNLIVIILKLEAGTGIQKNLNRGGVYDDDCIL